MSHWSVNYIGIPYSQGGREREGLDCWGLLRLVYQEHLKTQLPDLPGVTMGTIQAIAREIAERLAESWREVQTPQEFDGVAMSLREVPHHVGLWTAADGGRVIHAWDGRSVAAETLRSLRLQGIRTIKFYRYGLHN